MKNTIEKILIENIRLPHRPEENQDNAAVAEASRQIRKLLGAAPIAAHINKKSIDARRKPQISFVYSVYAEVEAGPKTIEKLEKAGIKRYTQAGTEIPCGTETLSERPVIIGFGPAGIFCGLLLAKAGLRPLILERGSDVAV